MITICVAIAVPKGTRKLTREELEKGWDSNRDGGGFSYVNPDGKIVTFKAMDKELFVEQCLDAMDKFAETSHFLVHMRIATHGEVKIENNHPYPVRTEYGETVLIHNGMIQQIPDEYTNKDTSDTMAFIQHVLDFFADDWMDSDEIVEIVEQYIGWSKLAILTTSSQAKHELYIINEGDGYWDDGVWFSNGSCHSTPTYTLSRKVSYKKSYWDDDDYVWDQYDQWVQDYQSVNKKYPVRLNTDDLYKDLLFEPRELLDMTADDYWEAVDLCNEYDCACSICTGIDNCHCHEMCYTCYEPAHECECSGAFVSLSDYAKDKQGVMEW